MNGYDIITVLRAWLHMQSVTLSPRDTYEMQIVREAAEEIEKLRAQIELLNAPKDAPDV